MNLKDNKQLVKQIRYLKSKRLFGSVIYYIMQNKTILGIDDVLELQNRTHTGLFHKENSFLKMAFRWETTNQSYSFWKHINKVLSKL
jgi:hypothetical protein